MSAVVTTSELLEARVHFGHQTSRWNPKMTRYLRSERNGIHIIDIHQTLQLLDVAYNFVRKVTSEGGVVLFVGTKPQAQVPIERYARTCAMPYVNQRWLGGTLTNFRTIRGRVEKMLEYERMERAGDFEKMPKKEALLYMRELAKLQRNLDGIRDMNKLPDAVFVLDTPKEHIAVAEANRLGLPVVAVADSNSDPDNINYVIPGNDDAIRSTNLLCRVIATAVKEGRFVAERTGKLAPAPDDRTPEEEARIAAEQEEARRKAIAEASEREARIAETQAAKAAAASAAVEMSAERAAEILHGDDAPRVPAAADTSDTSDAAEETAETAQADETAQTGAS